MCSFASDQSRHFGWKPLSLLQFCIRERLHRPALQGIREHLLLPVPPGCFVVVNVSTSLPSRVFVNISPSLSYSLQGDFDTLKLAKLFFPLLPVSHSVWFQHSMAG